MSEDALGGFLKEAPYDPQELFNKKVLFDLTLAFESCSFFSAEKTCGCLLRHRRFY